MSASVLAYLRKSKGGWKRQQCQRFSWSTRLDRFFRWHVGGVTSQWISILFPCMCDTLNETHGGGVQVLHKPVLPIIPTCGFWTMLMWRANEKSVYFLTICFSLKSFVVYLKQQILFMVVFWCNYFIRLSKKTVFKVNAILRKKQAS